MKSRKVTVYDIAKTAGVSPATVSRALAHPEQVQAATRKRITDVANELNFSKRIYRQEGTADSGISPSLSGDSMHKNILFCLPNFQNPFYSDLIDGAFSAASNLGCHALAGAYNITDMNIDSFLFMVHQFHFQGVIYSSAISDSLLTRLSEEIPLVQCSEYNSTIKDVSYVSIDDTLAEQHATQYVLSTGHTKVALMTSSFQYQYSKHRMQGFSAAMNERGFTVPSEWIIQLPRVDYAIAYDAALKLLSSENVPNAVIAVSDIYAAGCINAARTLGLSVPGDLIVAGFDNLEISSSTMPAITTINQPRFQLGYNACQILVNEIDDPESPKQHLFLPAELVIRESTASQL